MAKLEPAELAKHAPDLVSTLKDVHWKVRTAAAVSMSKLEPAELKKYADEVAVMLKDSHSVVRQAAVSTMAKLPASVAVEHILPLVL